MEGGREGGRGGEGRKERRKECGTWFCFTNVGV